MGCGLPPLHRFCKVGFSICFYVLGKDLAAVGVESFLRCLGVCGEAGVLNLSLRRLILALGLRGGDGRRIGSDAEKFRSLRSVGWWTGNTFSAQGIQWGREWPRVFFVGTNRGLSVVSFPPPSLLALLFSSLARRDFPFMRNREITSVPRTNGGTDAMYGDSNHIYTHCDLVGSFFVGSRLVGGTCPVIDRLRQI